MATHRLLALALATTAALPTPTPDSAPTPTPSPAPTADPLDQNALSELASGVPSSSEFASGEPSSDGTPMFGVPQTPLARISQQTNASHFSSLTLLSINFACRDVAHLSRCDNCQKRFDLIASAIRGEPGFSGLPDLGAVDAIVVQELGTSEQNFVQITAALAERGFTHTSGAPGPTNADPRCANPPIYAHATVEVVSALTGLESGGLVTFSRYPILSKSAHNWCVHNLPAPAGYLSTLLDVNGVATLIVNVHLFPEFDFGIDAKEVRTYQFSELRGFVDQAAAALREAGGPFAVVLGGDFNEDAYGLSKAVGVVSQPGTHCASITDQAAVNFASLNLDLRSACAAGIIGTPTWDPTGNDLAALFSSEPKYEVLDYVIAYTSSSSPGPDGASYAPNRVAPLVAQNGWTGEFCYSPITGTLDLRGTFEATVRSLTDHNSVTATVGLPAPPAPADRATAADAARDALAAVSASWRTEVQEAACGQSGALCAFDSNCCGSAYSWTNEELMCDAGKCAACKPIGASCTWLVEGSECCGYTDYTTAAGVPNGAHCEWGKCTRKFVAGKFCLHDEECQSRDCAWWKRCR